VPVADVFVTALRPDASRTRGFAFVDARLGSTTNPNGTYRLDVEPGEYFVIALPHNRVYAAGTRLNTQGFGNTFFPAAARVAEAGRVVVRGQTRAHADITLRPARLALVTGVVIGADGTPVAGGRLGVTHGDGLFGLDNRAVRIGTDGRFAAAGVAPGTYFFQYHGSAWPPPANVVPDVSGATVVVDGRDILDARVEPIHMVTATGRVIVDPVDARLLPPSSVTVGSQLVDFDGNPGPSRPGIVARDDTFTFKAWPGAAIVRVAIRAPGWRVKGIRYHGADITNTPIDFVEGQDVVGLEIALAPLSVPSR
jgi:hypothetical protein